MIVRRLAVTGAAVAAGLLPAAPVFAHGAPTAPISRTAACASGGLKTAVAACVAARVANGGPFGTFDNLRVPNVDGRDRDVVPDGKLCSGGLDEFRGLDVARTDFPATTVSGGKTLTVKYRATIPHQGSFRVYLTRAGYDPAKKLRWDDLGRTPLTQVTDPPLVGGAYTFGVKLPTDRTGRHILYIVWQTTSTVDTYYSCSDLQFRAKPAAATTAPRTSTASPAPSPTPSPSKATRPASSAPALAPADRNRTETPAAYALTPVSSQTQVTTGHRVLAGALLLALGALAWAGVTRKRRKRFENR